MVSDAPELLWRKMAGLFGADSVERKYGPRPPPEWAGLMRTLNDFELQRGLRRLAFSGKSHVPTLPEFLRMCRESGGDYNDAPQTIPQSHQLEREAQPRWDREGNMHLQAYFSRQAFDGVHYATARMRRYPMPRDMDHETQALVQPLVDAKNAWAEEMRFLEERGEAPADNGKALWFECIARAESVVAMVRAEAS